MKTLKLALKGQAASVLAFSVVIIATLATAGQVAAQVGPAPFNGAMFNDVLDAPHYGTRERLAVGGHGELRFGHDVVAGVADPEWFSISRVCAFVFARLHARADLVAQGAWDHGADAFVLERAELVGRVSDVVRAHAGIFLLPLGRSNLDHDAPENNFPERSLVATEIIGVPNAQLGIGVRGVHRAGFDGWLSYEVDVVTGFDDGLITDAAGGTRVPEGRSNYADNNGVPALTGRVALHPTGETEFGLAAQSGAYNVTELGGVRIDDRRYLHVLVADGTTRLAGFGIFGEAALAAVDVPPGLEALFAERQWGASLEAVRTLREPVVKGWKGSGLAVAVRVDAVDYDWARAGDSRYRFSTSVNVRRLGRAVARLGWYYEIWRNRFNSDTPRAGVAWTVASYF